MICEAIRFPLDNECCCSSLQVIVLIKHKRIICVLVHCDRSGDLIRHNLSFILREARETGRKKTFSWLCKAVRVPLDLGQWIWVTKARAEVSQDRGEECEG